KWKTKAGRDIVWRSRAPETPAYLAMLIADPATPTDELPRLLRAFDFQQPGPKTNAALAQLAFSEQKGEKGRQDFIATEAVLRLKNMDVKSQPQFAAAVTRVLDRARG